MSWVFCSLTAVIPLFCVPITSLEVIIDVVPFPLLLTLMPFNLPFILPAVCIMLTS